MPTYWIKSITTHEFTYSTPGEYDDELIIPIEKLQEFVDHQWVGHRHKYPLADLARKAVIEKGWQDTPYEGMYIGFDALHLAFDYLREKPDFSPEQQKEVAAALRDLGRFAFRHLSFLRYGGAFEAGMSKTDFSSL